MQNQAHFDVVTFNADGSFNTITLAGPVYRFTVPGGGEVTLQIGRFVFDSDGNLVFQAGHTELIDGDVAAYCAAFG
jgi:hypothetical protein